MGGEQRKKLCHIQNGPMLCPLESVTGWFVLEFGAGQGNSAACELQEKDMRLSTMHNPDFEELGAQQLWQTKFCGILNKEIVFYYFCACDT